MRTTTKFIGLAIAAVALFVTFRSVSGTTETPADSETADTQ